MCLKIKKTRDEGYQLIIPIKAFEVDTTFGAIPEMEVIFVRKI